MPRLYQKPAYGGQRPRAASTFSEIQEKTGPPVLRLGTQFHFVGVLPRGEGRCDESEDAAGGVMAKEKMVVAVGVEPTTSRM
jgi:hypothetical protein